ncbi:MAG: hypothetical protein HN576_08325 [Bacteriovoracaceae bacterium]|nr:hypothetical protein [Bacteriovoracaceae bacterium]
MKSRICIYLILFLLLSLDAPSSLASITSETSDSTWLTKNIEFQTGRGKFKAEIHFEKENIAFTQRVIEVLYKDAPKVLKYFAHVPSWTIHFIVEDSDTANGSATVFPTNIIKLNNHPPVGTDYLHTMEDWIQGLVLHELAHIIHMDQTRGIIGALVYVFGSYGKWTGITPRWFTEGIATWTESEFTDAGRLRSKMMDFEIRSKFLDKSFCQTIDCLDEPGVYPHGRTSYWLGSRFLAFLEKKKRGTIKCLIIENSDNIPFMLNSAFTQCAGADAPKLFKIFRKSIVKKAIKSYKKLKKVKFVQKELQKFRLPRNGKVINWQGGYQILGDSLASVVIEDKKSYFEFYNLDNKNKVQLSHPDIPIRVEEQSPFSQQSREYLLGLTKATSSFSRVWTIFNFRKKSYVDVTFDKSASYAFLLAKNEFLYLNYESDKWNVYHRLNDKEELYYSYNSLDEIFNPKLIDRYGKIWLATTIYHSKLKGTNKEFTYEALEINPNSKIKEKSTELLYFQRSKFNFAGSCGANDIFYSKGTMSLSHPKDLKWNKGSQIVEHYKIPFLKNVSQIKLTSDKATVLIDSDPHHIYLYNDICDTLIKKIRRAKLLSKTSHTKTNAISIPKDIEINYSTYDNYPNLDQFLPHYWTFLWTAGDNIDLFSAATSLSDPKRRHVIGLNYNFYSGINKSAPIVGYGYRMDDFGFALSYGESYSKSSFSTNTNSNKYKNAVLSYSLTLGSFSYTPIISYDDSTISDFQSDRKNTTLEFSQLLAYSTKKYYSFLQKFSMNYSIFNVESNRSNSYLGHKAKLKMNLRFSRNFYSKLKTTYGKLDKKGLKSGFLYGGGYESYGLSRYHEFYGISYSDALGNEITTAKAELGARLFEPYTGFGSLFPLYFKEIHALAGVNFLKTDYIFLDNSLFFRESLTSMYAGLKFKMTMAYSVPISLDLIYAQVNSPSGLTVCQTLFSISGGGIWP